jgi:hypothetical protein
MRTCALTLAAAIALSIGPGVSRLAAQDAEVVLTATSVNVAEAGNPARIRILRWSNDAERTAPVTALTPPPPAARGGAPAAAGERAAGAGRAGGGGRGRGRGNAPAAPVSPMAALTTAISRSPTVGYIWTNDITGYSVKYAFRAPTPDGGERIIIATDRRLGAHIPAWAPVKGTATDDEFTVIEIRLDPKGSGEGRTSLTAKVAVDKDAATVALENYAATPVMLQNIKRTTH